MDLSNVISLAVGLIKPLEGCVLGAYPDPATKNLTEEQAQALSPPRHPGEPFTIGFGATGAGIEEGVTWTQEQADADLTARVSKLATHICSDLGSLAIPDRATAAMCSLAYNIGFPHFATSSVLRLAKAEEWAAAADSFRLWNKAAGQVNKGLAKRREVERTFFLSGFDAPTS